MSSSDNLKCSFGNIASMKVLERVEEILAALALCGDTELDLLTSEMLKLILCFVKDVYSNNSLTCANEDEISNLKADFKETIKLIECLDSLLIMLIKNKATILKYITTVPIKIGLLIFLTFNHCKEVQTNATCTRKITYEMLDLFKKNQKVHTNYLSFLENLQIDFLSENEIGVCTEVLEYLLKIANSLSELNIQSIAANWKGFIMFLQKLSDNNVITNLSSAIGILSDQIKKNMIEIFTEGQRDYEKKIKFVGFLIKVYLKLFEVPHSVDVYTVELAEFWIMMHSWNQYSLNKQQNFQPEIIQSVSDLLQICSASISTFLRQNSNFIKELFLKIQDIQATKNIFSFLSFINIILEELPKYRHIINKFQVLAVLDIVFELSRKCYAEYFYDFNSDFYESLITNITVTILLYPDNFVEVEKILLNSIINENIWSALISIDVWSLVFKYSVINVCIETLNSFLRNLEDMHCNSMYHMPSILLLKFLTQRFFQILCIRKETSDIAKYNPSNNLNVWKVLSLRNVPLPYRYFVEFVMCDISDKMNVFDEINYDKNDVLFVIDNLNIISNTNFSNIQLSSLKLIPLVVRLWSFEVSAKLLDNKFYKYFLMILMKLTIAVAPDLSLEHLVVIMKKIKQILSGAVLKLLACDILKAVTTRNVHSFPDKSTIFNLVASIFLIMFEDQNEIVILKTAHTLSNLSRHKGFDTVLQKLSGISAYHERIIEVYNNGMTAGCNYNLEFLIKIQDQYYKHSCTQVNEGPVRKKMKLEEDKSSVIINRLQEDVTKLSIVVESDSISTRQSREIQDIINKLQSLLNQN